MKYTYFTLVLATSEHQAVGYKLVYVKVCVVFVQNCGLVRLTPKLLCFPHLTLVNKGV